MGKSISKTFGIALLSFVYCAIGSLFSKEAPIPALLWGIPVGAVAALVSVVVRSALRDECTETFRGET
jgi:VIT1/CCC1 family predicted Fe2+/Mn2+ transporter